MPTRRLFRRVAVIAAVLGLAGCVAPPQPLPPGSVVLSQQCAAGFYQCVLPQAGPVGTPCACPGLGAPSYGVIR
jgi:hypothetical protein